ncbi:MAG: sugar ABC transporter permease, partial [Clostridia bacterium]|nr:sugar ABC transporter permease [Clostridia bacterium]
YEVTKVEGATAWERFWKVTFPLLMPTILLNLVYTVIDEFTDYGNKIMVYITNMTQLMKIGYSSALALIYFIIVLVLAGTSYLIIKKASSFNT